MKILKKISLFFLIGFLHFELKAESLFIEMPLISAQQLQEEMQVSKNCNLKKKYCRNADLVVINVLSPSVCADCSIPGSINVPLDKLVKKSQLWKKDTNIVLHCASLHCPLSRYAFDMLFNLGFTRVRVFDGGLQDWSSKSFPRVGRCRAGYLRI